MPGVLATAKLHLLSRDDINLGNRLLPSSRVSLLPTKSVLLHNEQKVSPYLVTLRAGVSNDPSISRHPLQARGANNTGWPRGAGQALTCEEKSSVTRRRCSALCKARATQMRWRLPCLRQNQGGRFHLSVRGDLPLQEAHARLGRRSLPVVGKGTLL